MKKRELSIDFLRAIAILLMTITHVNALLYTGDNIILDIFTTAGATLCFSIFLFCSAYTVGLRIEENKKFDIKNTAKRILEIYLVYLVLGIFITFVLEKQISLNTILNIVILNYVPEFTEFLIAFIIFSFIPLIFQKQIKSLLSKPIYLIFLTILMYTIGILIYNLISKYTLSDILRIPLENIFGYKSLHRFPLTYYLPIYTFGILLSKYNSKKILISILLISVILFTLLYSFEISHWYRWPPSPLFLLYGFIFIPLVLIKYTLLKNFLTKGVFKLFTNMGRYPLEQLFLSTLLVFLAKLLFLPTGNEILSITVNISIFILLMLHPIVFHRKMV